MCLNAEPLPVLVYGREAPTGQAFARLHEFGHVPLGLSGIGGGPSPGGDKGACNKEVEGWCNRFAGRFPMPDRAIARAVRKPAPPQADFDLHMLSDLTRRFAVSRHALLVRRVTLDCVASDFYWQTVRPAFQKEEEVFSSFGGPGYYSA